MKEKIIEGKTKKRKKILMQKKEAGTVYERDEWRRRWSEESVQFK
jgi:hypothetical protein